MDASSSSSGSITYFIQGYSIQLQKLVFFETLIKMYRNKVHEFTKQMWPNASQWGSLR